LLLKSVLKYFVKYILLFILVCNVILGKSQSVTSPDNDLKAPLILNKKHSPHKAAMYSALVPGLGQIYNERYWKLPIIYGAAGVLIYAFDFNNDRYNRYKNAYADMDAGKITSFEGFTDKDVLLRLKDNYRRNRDLNVIIMAGVYLLNVVDATVDAHLFDYDISDDLSLNIQPDFRKNIDYNYSYGLCLRVSF